jgi:hypothetical protein
VLGHPSQVTERSKTTMTTHTHPAHADLRRLLVVSAAVFASAGGLIHLAVIRQHFDFPIVAGGFAFIGIAKWTFALTVLRYPTRLIVAFGGIVHIAIAGIWILSRTTGLPFLPGAEEPALVGVVDIVANTFSVGAIGAVIIWRVLSQSSNAVFVSIRVARSMLTVLLAGSLFLIVPALFTPHDHASHALNEIPAHSDVHQHEAGTAGSHRPVRQAPKVSDGHLTRPVRW